MRLLYSLVLMLLCGLVACTTPALAALSAPQTLYLDAHDPANDGDAGPVATSDVLATGVQYVADVSGTYNAYSPDVWTFHNSTACGSPDAVAMTPSPGAVETAVGQDAETVFGMPWVTQFCPALPHHGAGFEVDTGSGFVHPDTAAGKLSTPTPDHRYSYPLVGQDQPARFRIFDKPTSDDNGILTIVVHPVTPLPATPSAPSAPAPAPADAGAPTIQLPSTKTCVRRRRIHLRLKAHQGDAITAATVRLNGRTVRRVRRAHGKTSRVLDMHLTVAGKTGCASVLVTARTRHGRVVVARKVYRVCKR